MYEFSPDFNRYVGERLLVATTAIGLLKAMGGVDISLDVDERPWRSHPTDKDENGDPLKVYFQSHAELDAYKQEHLADGVLAIDSDNTYLAGGNAYNQALAMLEMGLENLYLTGHFSTDARFSPVRDRATIFNLGEETPETHAQNCGQERVLYGNSRTLLNKVTWPVINALAVQRLGSQEAARDMLRQMDIFFLPNHREVRHWSDIARGLGNAVRSLNRSDRPLLMVDPASLDGFPQEAVRSFLKLLMRKERVFRVMFTIDGAEAGQVLKTLDKDFDPEDATPDYVADAAKYIRDLLGLSYVVIHLRCCAAIAWSDQVDHRGGAVGLPGFYASKTQRLVGAGDMLNGTTAICLELADQGFTPPMALQAGAAASGYLVRHAKPASLDRLARFMIDFRPEV